MTYDWAEYKRKERAHHKNNHERCSYRYCRDRQAIEDANNCHLFAIALMDELERLHLDPVEFFGDGWTETKALIEAEFPEWLEQEPDEVTRILARSQIAISLLK